MRREVLLLSVRPSFTRQILDGTKTIELRRVRPQAKAGQMVLIYGSSPTMALLAYGVVERIEMDKPNVFWPRVQHSCGIGWNEYQEYFRATKQAVGIWLRDVTALRKPLALSELRERWPWFRPPQSFCFVRARVDSSGRCITGMAQRF